MDRLVVVSGKRKTAISRVKIKEGKGSVVVNNNPYENLKTFHRLIVMEPVRITEQILGKFNFDVDVRVKGGGKEGQMQAARLGIAKALVKLTGSKELRDAFLKYDRHLLVADVRRKEQRKPGDSKARAKRQKSYR